MSDRLRNIFTQDIAAQRQRQTGFAFPPLAKIDNLLKTRMRIGQLSFVNDQTRIGAPVFHGVENLIELNDNVFEIPQIKLQR